MRTVYVLHECRTCRGTRDHFEIIEGGVIELVCDVCSELTVVELARELVTR